MTSLVRTYFLLGRLDPETVKRVLGPLQRKLPTGEPADTVTRVFESHHVNDLRLICAVSQIVMFWILGFDLLIALDSAYVEMTSHADVAGFCLACRAFAEGAATFLKFFGPPVVVFGAILAWAYQVASARLGVVDLFACEISTLCRVTTVVGAASRQIKKFGHGPCADNACAAGPAGVVQSFTSQENYFPVFEANTRDLQTLEARVVVNITAFYTYMKAMRDSLRALALTRPDPDESGVQSVTSPAAGPWHKSMCNVVYMLYLGLESARHAIDDLVEFEPEKAERLIVILISELAAYRFLRFQFPDPDELHHKRLMLRDCEYPALVDSLIGTVTGHGRSAAQIAAALNQPLPLKLRKDWGPALQSLPELQKRCSSLVGLPA